MSAPGCDDREDLGQPMDYGVRLAEGVADLLLRDVAVRQVDRAHSGGVRSVDVVEEPVADEYARAGIGRAHRGHGRLEGLRRRLRPGDGRRVDGAVDEVE